MDPLFITAMQRAHDLAQQGIGHVEPNPPVGCVLCDATGNIVAEGYHARFGSAHAEAAALAQAKSDGIDTHGLTAVVTLEPCVPFEGKKTPSCTNALIEAGIKRVIIGCLDPHPEVAGRGAQTLRDAGIDVIIAPADESLTDLIDAFRIRAAANRPKVFLKWAQTVDGALATQSGDSKWISGETSRQKVHQLRSVCDAIVVGIGTAQADNPSLTVRGCEDLRHPLRVVIDPALEFSTDATMLNDDLAPVVIACDIASLGKTEASALRECGAKLIGLPRHSSGGLCLRTLWQSLERIRPLTRVLIEGGSRLHAHALNQQMADEILVFVAPKLLGGGIPAVRGWNLELMSEALNLEPMQCEPSGRDWLLTYRPSLDS